MTTPPLIVIGHGTRRAEGVGEFLALIDRVRRRGTGQVTAVEGGLIELAAPGVDEAMARLLDPDRLDPDLSDRGQAAGQATVGGTGPQVVAVPLMLGTAGHVRVDIPRLLDAERSRHPGLVYRYARALGPHPVLVDLLADRIDTALNGTSRDGTQVVLVGRGCSAPHANARVAMVARLLWEARGYDAVDVAFVAVTGPSLPQTLERVRRCGAGRIVVAPYLLFHGLLSERIAAETARFAADNPGLDVRRADLIGDCDEIADLVLERYRQAAGGEANPVLRAGNSTESLAPAAVPSRMRATVPVALPTVPERRDGVSGEPHAPPG